MYVRVFNPIYSQSGHHFLFPCLKNHHKHTRETNDLRYELFLSLSLSLEVVMIGPESHVSHTQGGAAFAQKQFCFFFLFLFPSLVSHVIPVSQYIICRLFPWFNFLLVIYFFSGFVRLKEEDQKLCLKFQV